jgi:hypothetical protein
MPSCILTDNIYNLMKFKALWTFSQIIESINGYINVAKTKYAYINVGNMKAGKGLN